MFRNVSSLRRLVFLIFCGGIFLSAILVSFAKKKSPKYSTPKKNISTPTVAPPSASAPTQPQAPNIEEICNNLSSQTTSPKSSADFWQNPVGNIISVLGTNQEEDAPSSGIDSMENTIFDKINEERQKYKISLLIRESTHLAALQRIARSYSTKLSQATDTVLRHDLDGMPKDRLQRANIPYSIIAENLAMASSPIAIHQALLKSPAHCKNLLNPKFQHVTIGLFPSANGQLYVTQIFRSD